MTKRKPPRGPANKTDDSADDVHVPASERVGYGQPPVGTRFQPGVSGNPRGRPKGAKNFATIVAASLNERVTVKVNGRPKKITKLEAAVTQLVNRAAGGEAKSIQLLIRLVQATENKPVAADPDKPSPADLEVMRALERRLRGDPE